jgi:dihydrofolate synthase / folylpolyglutamate synthase
VGLRGRHQAANVAVADATLDALEAAGIAVVPPDARRRGYADARWPGRLELFTIQGRDVLLDGAHNPAGAATLAEALDDLRPFLVGGADRTPPALTLVMGAMADKDVDGIVAALAGAAALHGARVIATRVDLPRALPAQALAGRWRTLVPDVSVEAVGDVGAALERALGSGGGPIVVAGSLYLVGEARRRWLPDPLLDDPEEPPA